ncbi:MAG: ABC-2 type transport system ATP-binding protein [Saliniramus fredricksonii]|uniref:ABC-2 type transport system ATP-binding protein n=1 Tax=Saliniramus fredricksonii TaxID=1653334 RepID=A0A0P7ZVL7_9HYPH|nr:ABC transporter ATP-binding protein [Saliniramus fredricksonii]KPQ08772.1 MAG: ABC-2 type transport system ATP-binding protein [Saliniramus fredricksonii]SCC78639.1 ABC-2 type transport system ATP-binding protein [Saliniramus fredricksonii]
MTSIIAVRGLRKAYDSGFEALKGVDLDIEEGEIIALLGPNGAGKTTLISTICGITRSTAGSVSVGGHDIHSDYRAARAMIGLVPQEISLEPFETIANTVRFSRGLFGQPPDEARIDRLLAALSLSEKKNARNRELSGGMKRRVMIAKALSHEPRVLFLDEPTAGVDVELRREMWDVVKELRRDGVTIILTTHYIEEAEAIADRIAVINRGEILLVEKTGDLMARMGRKELEIMLEAPLNAVPESLSAHALTLSADGRGLVYGYDGRAQSTGVGALMADIQAAGLPIADIRTRQSSLEEIFVGLVKDEN